MEYTTGRVYTNEVYYRIYRTDRNNLMTVVCMQNFDEYDYDSEQFVKNSDGEPYLFYNEEDAATKLRDWYIPEQIDPEYRKGDTFLIR